MRRGLTGRWFPGVFGHGRMRAKCGNFRALCRPSFEGVPFRTPYAYRPAARRRNLPRQSVPWIEAALQFVFPPVCVDCGVFLDEAKGPPLLCGPCTQQLCRDDAIPTCLGCGLPQSPDWPAAAVCLECRKKSFRFDEVVSLGIYRDHLRRSVIRTKQFHEFPLTTTLGHLLTDQLIHKWGDWRPHVVVPIPKYWVKRIMRGTNTSEVLAETVGRRLHLPVAVKALWGRRSTRKQSLLGRAERHRNVAGSLQLVRGHDFDRADVLIVDDIMTTGATADEAARVLSRAGAGRISVAVVARAAHGREALADRAASARDFFGRDGVDGSGK